MHIFIHAHGKPRFFMFFLGTWLISAYRMNFCRVMFRFSMFQHQDPGIPSASPVESDRAGPTTAATPATTSTACSASGWPMC